MKESELKNAKGVPSNSDTPSKERPSSLLRKRQSLNPTKNEVMKRTRSATNIKVNLKTIDAVSKSFIAETSESEPEVIRRGRELYEIESIQDPAIDIDKQPTDDGYGDDLFTDELSIDAVSVDELSKGSSEKAFSQTSEKVSSQKPG